MILFSGGVEIEIDRPAVGVESLRRTERTVASHQGCFEEEETGEERCSVEVDRFPPGSVSDRANDRRAASARRVRSGCPGQSRNVVIQARP